MAKSVAIIQARMGSTRLPGKVLKIINDKPVLEHVLDRVKRARGIDQIVVATSILERDKVIEDFCSKKKVLCFRGSEVDLLDRYYQCAKSFSAETVVRITSDCPLIEPEIIDLMLGQYDPVWAYFSNCHPVRVVPVGLDVEITSFWHLQRAHIECKDPYQREHVFPFFYQNPDKFIIKNLEKLNLDPDLRLTLDTPEDLEMIKKIYEHFKDRDFFGVREIEEYLSK